MRHSNHTVFDEFIPQNTNGTVFAYTGANHNAQLGRFSQLGIHVVVDNVAGTGTFSLQIEESADGRNWLTRQGTAEILNLAIATNGNQAKWSDACNGSTLGTGPLLGFVRFRMQFSNGTTSAHVKVHITQRGHHS